MDRGVLRARPGGRSCATTRTISGLPTCSPCPSSPSRRCTCWCSSSTVGGNWCTCTSRPTPRQPGCGASSLRRPPGEASHGTCSVIGTLRRECLDHVIILDEHHLLSVLREFVTYYNQDRPHRTLGLQIPEQRPRSTTGRIRSRPVLNGLHHVYERAA